MSEKFIYWLPLYFFIFVNLFYSICSWEEIRDHIGWVSVIPQKTNFKLRHLFQYVPQGFYVSTLVFLILKKSHKKAILCGISFVLLQGALSEFLQNFTSSRIPSFIDIGWDLLAGILGSVLASLVIYFTKVKDIWSVKKQIILNIVMISFVCFAILYWKALIRAPQFDFYRFWLASKISSSETLDYWLHVFTVRTHGAQYRPFSFFVIPFLTRSLLGDNILYYHIYSALLFFTSVVFLWKFLNNFFSNIYSKSVGIFVYLIFFGHYELISVISYSWKYYFPFIVLTYCLNKILEEKVSKRDNLLILLLLIISIPSQEGSFVFPILFVALDFLKNKRIKLRHFIWFIPSIIYAFFRFVLWKVPNKGFMSLNFLQSFKTLGYYIQDFISSAWGIAHEQYIDKFYWLGSIFLILWLVLSIINRKRYQIAFSLLVFLVCILPFAILDGHIRNHHMLWSVLGIVLLFSSLFDKFFSTSLFKKKKLLISHFLLFFCAAILLGVRSNLKTVTVKAKARKIELHERVAAIKRSIEHIDKDKYISIDFKDTELKWVTTSVVPSFLAFYFPERKFIIRATDFNSRSIFIKDGAYYWLLETAVYDSYRFKHSFKPEGEIFRAKDFPKDIASFFTY